MYCPDCGTHVESNFCPTCGKDMRNVVIKKIPPQKHKSKYNNYSEYMQYYPDKTAAIKRLRADTGMGIVQAETIITNLFEAATTTPQSPVSTDEQAFTVTTKATKRKVKKAVATAGAVAAGGLFAGLKVIFYVAKKYT